jgi:hypothetical protein
VRGGVCVNLLSLLTAALLLSGSKEYSATAVKAPSVYTGNISWVVPRTEIIIGESVRVRPGRTFLEIPIFPEHLYELEDNLVTLDGKLISSKGSQLIKLESIANIYCTPNWTDEIEFKGLDKRTGHFNGNACFEDSDRDGDLDQFIKDDFAGFIGPSRFGRNRVLIHDIFPKKLDSGKFRYHRNLYFNYLGHSSFGNTIKIGVCSGENQNMHKYLCMRDSLTDVKINTSNIPINYHAIGSNFSIISFDDDHIVLKQTSPVPAQKVILFW